MRQFTIKYRNNNHSESGVEFDNGHIAATCECMAYPLGFNSMEDLELKFRAIFGGDTGAWTIEWVN